MKSILSLLAPFAFAMGFASSVAAAGALPTDRVPHREKGAFPLLALPDRAAGGQRAIDLLKDRLAEVAEFYGKSPDELKSQLINDLRLRVDQRGRLFAIDELEAPLPEQATPQQSAMAALLDGTLLPLDQTFVLHSRPGAKRTIYLNFKGAVLTGTAWNSSSGSITAAPFDIDGVPGNFSTAELQRIQYIWQRVAEDYAAFDVNVTTEAVPLDQINRSGSADDVFGTVVLITKRAGVYNCSCGGVAYLGVFDDTSAYYKPALVFYDALGNGSEKYVAEAISHEAGHNMGLGHDGTASSGYYGGHGSGATAWAPIMGVGYSKPLVQWSKGEYTGANNAQDDYAQMQSNGLPLRADDHGNTAAAATVLAGTVNGGVSTATEQGVIERPTDTDVFAFTAAPGQATVSIAGAVRASNLDALVTLKNAAGTILATANPVDALNADLTVNLPTAGTYHVVVQGTGKADPKATGYSSYGSIGQYALTVSHLVAANQAPVARITPSTLRGVAPLAVSFNGSTSTDADGSITSHAWNFGDGGSATGASTSHTYASPGSYTVQLTVTDSGGMTNASSVVITVDPAVAGPTMRVADIAMSWQPVTKWGTTAAIAAVKVVNASGAPVAGVTVKGDWSGLVSLPGRTMLTNSAGVARFTSPTVTSFGTFVFTVTQVSRSGNTYLPLTNTETSDSITR
jgi:PKD repeat protein